MKPEMAEELIKKLYRVGPAGVLVDGKRVLYFSPAGLPAGAPPADVIFIPGESSRHRSFPDIKKIATAQTIVVGRPSHISRFPCNLLSVEAEKKGAVLGMPIVSRKNPAAPGETDFLVTVDGLRLAYVASLSGGSSAFGEADVVFSSAPEKEVSFQQAISAMKRMRVRFFVPLGDSRLPDAFVQRLEAEKIGVLQLPGLNGKNRPAGISKEKTSRPAGPSTTAVGTLYRPKTAADRITFTWNIHHSCNYRCPYCFMATDPIHTFRKNSYPALDQLVGVWERMYRLYGSCVLKISGGEPFIYPHFVELLEGLSAHHFLDFSSNLSWDVRGLIGRLPPRSVHIDPSFHPGFYKDIEEFAEKCLLLKKQDSLGSVHIVAYPPFLQKMRGYKEVLQRKGLDIVFLPFRGRYRDKQYPESYSPAEKELLRDLARSNRDETKNPPAASAPPAAAKPFIEKVNEQYFSWFVENKNAPGPQGGRLCWQGARYGKIYSNLDVYRCCTREDSPELYVGNLLDPEFRLLDGPRPCPMTDCACWKAMLCGQENTWKTLWNTENFPMPARLKT
ncbi:MAG TPA: hypothetical protein P5079_00645 [Elusimicrobiota bacterium]|nr:hypothetical protein [Elusimicrobiota bacterium]